MSDQSQGPGWWLASDGRWYPPEAVPAGTPTWTSPPPGYGYAYGPTGPSAWGPPMASANSQAVASMVLGIVAVVLACLWPISLICALVALPLGISVVRRINRGDVAPQGKAMAVAGIVLSSIVLAVAIVIIVLIAAAANSDAALAPVRGWSS